jgi:hypothetical protein
LIRRRVFAAVAGLNGRVDDRAVRRIRSIVRAGTVAEVDVVSRSVPCAVVAR